MIAAASGLSFFSGSKLVPLIACVGGLGLLLIGLTAILRRRQVHVDSSRAGLFGVVGRMGGGKSYFLTFVALEQLRRGRMVFANYALPGSVSFAEYESGSSARAVEFSSWDEVLRVPDGCLVIFDEVQLWWPSDAWQAPIDVRLWITTLRHRHISAYWASQSVRFVARWLRDLSFGVWECEPFKAGSRYTLFDPAVAERRGAGREYLSRVVMVRKKSVISSYDSFNTARHSVQWGGDSDLAVSLGTAGGGAPPPGAGVPARGPRLAGNSVSL